MYLYCLKPSQKRLLKTIVGISIGSILALSSILVGINSKIADAGAAKCIAESISKSTSGKLTTEITFDNQLKKPVKIYWLNYSGERVFYRQLQSKESYTQQTYVTHPWVVTDVGDACLGVYYPDSKPRVVKLKNSSASNTSNLLENTLVIPGKRVGPITNKTTRSDLGQLFGESRLEDTVIYVDEGTLRVPITKVNLGPTRSFTVSWKDDSGNKIRSVQEFGSEWEIEEDIGIGTSFTELKSILGKFKLNGLGWDNGGYIHLCSTKLCKYKGILELRVGVTADVAKKFPKELQNVSGDRIFSSTNPNWKNLEPQIVDMVVRLN